MLRDFLLLDALVEVLVLVVHAGEPEPGEVLRDAPLAKVRVVYPKLVLGLLQRQSHAKQEGFDVLIRLEGCLAVVRGVDLERVVHRRRRRGGLGPEGQMLKEMLLPLLLVLLALDLAVGSVRRDDLGRIASSVLLLLLFLLLHLIGVAPRFHGHSVAPQEIVGGVVRVGVGVGGGLLALRLGSVHTLVTLGPRDQVQTRANHALGAAHGSAPGALRRPSARWVMTTSRCNQSSDGHRKFWQREIISVLSGAVMNVQGATRLQLPPRPPAAATPRAAWAAAAVAHATPAAPSSCPPERSGRVP